MNINKFEDDELVKETYKLIKSWERHDKEKLKMRLVLGRHDPRVNMQSIVTRHFFIKELFGDEFNELMEEEIDFSKNINGRLYQEFGELMKHQCEGDILLSMRMYENILKTKKISVAYLNKYQEEWAKKLAIKNTNKISVIEPACGSANDYRFMHTFGIARFLEYKGFDLSEKSIRNAKEMFPRGGFEVGNIMKIDYKDNSFDYLIAHDIFEHLSIKALEKSLREICRVTKKGMILNFFNMSNIQTHKIKPVKDYYWNELSVSSIQEFFEDKRFATKIIKITDIFPEYYNKKACTLIFRKI